MDTQPRLSKTLASLGAMAAVSLYRHGTPAMQDRFGASSTLEGESKEAAVSTPACLHAAAQTRKLSIQCALSGVNAHRVQLTDFDRIDDFVTIPHSAK